ncbi:MAG TPA: lysophospholipid acyltransferase family protein [Bacteroidales bacterium]|nr:lysophospholipid acyltransferase family protein [Bacteroidales bacterium]HQQ12113.1 lysophospholipid acyltransferase family protein [Bacteroidales bacterium]
MKTIATIALKLAGWKIIGGIPADVKKCVILAAPHTSNWDFVIGRLAYWYLDVPVKFLIKKEAFAHPLGFLVKRMGGIPVDRKKNTNLVEQVAELFNHYDVLNVIITPEGTRKLVKEWKKGFYYIALRAQIPIALGFVDYKNKIGGFGPTFYPSGNFEEDFKMIENFYRNKSAKNPALFNLSPENTK